MGIIDSLKRLERIGEENSKTTRKIKEATAEVAEQIAETVPAGVAAGGYKVITVRSNVGKADFLFKDGIYYNQLEDGYLHGDFHACLTAPTREECLQFAADIANGLIDKFAAEMERRAQADREATATLEAAEVA